MIRLEHHRGGNWQQTASPHATSRCEMKSPKGYGKEGKGRRAIVNSVPYQLGVLLSQLCIERVSPAEREVHYTSLNTL